MNRSRRLDLARMAALAVAGACAVAAPSVGSATQAADPQPSVLAQTDMNPALIDAALAGLAEKQRLADSDVVSVPAGAVLSAKEAQGSFEDVPWYAEGKAEEAVGAPDRGIFEEREAPAPSIDFLATNRWTGLIDGREVTVYAGTAGWERPETGMIMVVWTDADVTGAVGVRLSQAAAGALRVTDFRDGIVEVYSRVLDKTWTLNMRASELQLAP